MTRCAELINNNTEVDFVDINSGCPIDLVYKKVRIFTMVSPRPPKKNMTHPVFCCSGRRLRLDDAHPQV